MKYFNKKNVLAVSMLALMLAPTLPVSADSGRGSGGGHDGFGGFGTVFNGNRGRGQDFFDDRFLQRRFRMRLMELRRMEMQKIRQIQDPFLRRLAIRRLNQKLAMLTRMFRNRVRTDNRFFVDDRFFRNNNVFDFNDDIFRNDFRRRVILDDDNDDRFELELEDDNDHSGRH